MSDFPASVWHEGAKAQGSSPPAPAARRRAPACTHGARACDPSARPSGPRLLGVRGGHADGHPPSSGEATTTLPQGATATRLPGFVPPGFSHGGPLAHGVAPASWSRRRGSRRLPAQDSPRPRGCTSFLVTPATATPTGTATATPTGTATGGALSRVRIPDGRGVRNSDAAEAAPTGFRGLAGANSMAQALR